MLCLELYEANIGSGIGISDAATRALSQRFFADARFLGVILSEMPSMVALWRVAPSVRLRDFAILASGSLRAMPLSRRRSSFVHARLTGAFLRRTKAFTTRAPIR